MAARRVVGIDVGLAEAFCHSTAFRFIAAGVKHWDTVNRTGAFVDREPTGADWVATSGHTINGHTINDSGGNGFLGEPRGRPQWNSAGDKRGGEHCGRPSRRESSVHSGRCSIERVGRFCAGRQARSKACTKG